MQLSHSGVGFRTTGVQRDNAGGETDGDSAMESTVLQASASSTISDLAVGLERN